MPSSGCTLTRPRAGAQTGRNKNNPRLPEIGGYIFAVNLYKLYMKGRSKNSKGAHPKSRKFKGEKRRNESIKARSTPFRSPPIIPQCFSKNHSKTRESKIFLIDFFDSSQKWQTKKTPNTRRCWGLTIISLYLSFLSSCCALHHSNISALICQYSTTNCNFYKCTFKNHDLK